MSFKVYAICLLLGASIFHSSIAKATHIVGGEVFYDHQGGNKYLITLYLYLDCINGTPAALEIDAEANIAIYRKNSRTLFDNFTVDSLRTSEVKNVNYTCLFPPDDVCVVRYVFQKEVTLPDIAGGYVVAYQRCCRNSTVLNLRDEESTGGTYWVQIPERKNFGNNSSPRFDIQPPNFVCLNKELSVVHSATDPDGDSLVYELCIPFEGATPTDPAPDIPDGPPYSNVQMGLGYGLQNFMYANPKLKIRPQTGELTCTPRRLGQYVVGICVKEYRNGVLLSTVVRDFQINVIQCQFDVVSAFILPEQKCDLKVNFGNKSEGAIAYRWEFGDPSTLGDTSLNKTVSYDYPTPGKYRVKLIAYSEDCNDTFDREIYVRPDTGAFAGPDVRSCNGEQVRIGPTTFFRNAKYEWSPSLHLSSDTAKRPLASPPVDFTYVLKQTFDYCYGFDTVEVKTGPPVVDFEYDPLEECRNMTYRFKNTGEGKEFFWTFGTNRSTDTSYRQNPYFTFPREKSFTVKLVAALNPGCKDSLEQTIFVVEDTTGFAGYDRFICFGEQTRLGEVDKMGLSEFSWTPGEFLTDTTVSRPIASPEQSTTFYLRKFTDYCEVFDSVFVIVDQPKPFFQLAYTAPCDGLGIKLFNASENCIEYLWDFGVASSTLDTSTSKDSVSYQYPKPGDYVISLKGTSLLGCEWTYELPLDVFTDTAQFAGPDINICLGEELEIGLDDSVSFAKFFWTPKDSVSNSGIANPTVKPNDTLTYTVMKVYPECTFYDTVTVGVHDPLADFTTDYDPHCDLFDIELINTSERFDDIIWEVGNQRVNSTDRLIKSTLPGEGGFLVSIYAFKEQCSDTITRSFKAFVDTGVTLIPDSVICLQDSIFIGQKDTAKNVRYSWSPVESLSDSTISNPSAFPTESTTYTVKRIFPKCQYTSSTSIRVAHPEASFDTLVRPDCFGYLGEFTNTSSGSDNYRWVFGQGSNSTENDELRLFPYGNKLKATLYAIDAHCVDIMTVERALLPFDSFEVLTPNIFTPNGDGFNDCYQIKIPKLPADCRNVNVSFFNRWGQEMFKIHVNGNEYCWDGTNQENGIEASPGVYFYLIDVLGKQFNGALHLVR